MMLFEKVFLNIIFVELAEEKKNNCYLCAGIRYVQSISSVDSVSIWPLAILYTWNWLSVEYSHELTGSIHWHIPIEYAIVLI